MSLQIAKHYFTVGDYERMGEVGILPADKRYELIEGEIIEMSPIGRRHAACVKRLNRAMNHQADATIIVSTQDPIVLDDGSEPQPDVCLLKFRADFYETSHPTPADVLVVIEVADTTLDYDRGKKLALYARALIPEVLIFNLTGNQLEYHADPADGGYRITRILRRGEHLQTSSAHGITFDVTAILG